MVTIRPFDQKNLALHYKWNTDEKRDYNITRQAGQVQNFKQFLRQIKSTLDKENRSDNLFEIHLTENNKLIGVVNLYAIDYENKSCFVNCEIGDTSYNTTKYKIDALWQVLGYCFDELKMDTVMTADFNHANGWEQQVQKLGFTKTAGLPSVDENASHSDHVFRLMAKEYQKEINSTPLKAVN